MWFFSSLERKNTKIVKKTKQVNSIGYGDLFYFSLEEKKKKKS